MTTANELKPCPFCGKQPITMPSGVNDTGLMIQCMTKDCLGPHCSYIPPASAIKVWNTRAQPKKKNQELSGGTMYHEEPYAGKKE